MNNIGICANAPKIYVDAQGQADGMLIDLLRQIAKPEGWELRFVSCEWTRCLNPCLHSAAAFYHFEQFGYSGTDRRRERLQQVDFLRPRAGDIGPFRTVRCHIIALSGRCIGSAGNFMLLEPCQ